ncbi:hypothetical protein [Crucivirus-438]|nr:hypothetical protein [Crucivirus-438]
MKYRNIVRDLHESDEDVVPFRYWPLWAKQLFLKSHKNNNERFRMFSFLFLNGMYPPHIPVYVLWHGGYDSGAVADVHHMVTKAMNGHRSFTAANINVIM